MQEMLNEKQVAKLVNLSLQTLRNYRAAKKLFPYVKLGRSVRYPADEVARVVRENQIECKP